jgi:two-component system, OmpR family, response regulator
MKLLLVEDDNLVADSVVVALQGSGYAIDRVANGHGAQSVAGRHLYDLIILDLGLPDMDGLECLRIMRSRMIKIPILILTARDSPEHRVQGLDAGANDYVAKPFHLAELEARIRALLRLVHSNELVVRAGQLSWDTKTRVLRQGEELIELSAKEHVVLEALLQNRNALVTRQRLALLLANYDTLATHNAIDIIIHRLRKRLEPYGLKLLTVRGLGFLVEP